MESTFCSSDWKLSGVPIKTVNIVFKFIWVIVSWDQTCLYTMHFHANSFEPQLTAAKTKTSIIKSIWALLKCGNKKKQLGSHCIWYFPSQTICCAQKYFEEQIRLGKWTGVNSIGMKILLAIWKIHEWYLEKTSQVLGTADLLLKHSSLNLTKYTRSS